MFTRSLLALAAVLAAAPARSAEPFAEGLVSLTFDDNCVTQYTRARPALNARGYHATFYLITDGGYWGGCCMSFEQARTLAAEGHEIGSHSVTHPSLIELSDAALVHELADSQRFLVENLGLAAVPSLASPYGDYDQRVVYVASQYYASHRTVEDGLNFLDTDHYRLKSFSANRGTTLAQVLEQIDAAIEQRGWLTIFFHNLVDTIDGSTDWAYSDFVAVLDYLAARNVRVVTVSEGLAHMDGAPLPVPPPTLAAVVPTSGPIDGGTEVTLTGSHFEEGATVTFGDVPATVVGTDLGSISATSPAHLAGTVAVTVTNPDGYASTLAASFTFEPPAPPPPPPDPPPTLATVIPDRGPTAGGTAVTISGTGFAAGATVTVGGTAAVVRTVEPTAIEIDTPAHGAGRVDVTVTNHDGRAAALSGAFEFESPAAAQSPPQAEPDATPAPAPTPSAGGEGRAATGGCSSAGGGALTMLAVLGLFARRRRPWPAWL
jgi:MYXO-CTERM domain-containing protein